MIKLSVNLLTYNGAKYLPHLFDSLRQQTFKDWQLLILDNGSTDNTIEIVKKELDGFNHPWQLEINKDNVGFARGHNQLLKIGQGRENTEFVLLLNQDVVLASDYFEKLVIFMDQHPQASAAQGLLFRWLINERQKNNSLDTTAENEFSHVIDSLGLKVLRNRRVVDFGAGQNLSDFKLSPAVNGFQSLSSPIEIFGITGPASIYRLRALEGVAINGEVLDEDFFSYKEDVDLAYRLCSAGWKAYLVPEARAWHRRSARNQHKLRDPVIGYHSYKNHLFLLIKNEYFVNLLRDWPWIFGHELRKLFKWIIFDRQILKSLREFRRLLPKMLEKRRIIKSKRKLFAREIRKWYAGQ